MGSGIMEWFELEVTFKIIYFQPPTIGKDATNVKILTILTPPPSAHRIESRNNLAI